MLTYQNAKFFVFFIGIFYFLLLIFDLTFAQTPPQFLVSWQAESYAPSWYQGKVFPTRGTPVEVNFELIDNGRIADLSQIKVRWYLNDQLVKNENDGLGIKSLRVTIPNYAGQETEVRISLPDYRGRPLDNIVRIPINAPEVVIDGRFPSREITVGENFFEAIPFFFNIEDINNLSFEWLANGERAQEDSDSPWFLTLNIDSRTPKDFPINLRASVQNFFNQLEAAVKDVQLIIK